MSSSNSDNSFTNSSSFLPSLVFILTPVLGISILLCWSIIANRRSRRRARLQFGNNDTDARTPKGEDPGEKPVIQEVWIDLTPDAHKGLYRNGHHTFEEGMTRPNDREWDSFHMARSPLSLQVYGGGISSDPQQVLNSSPPRRSSATIVSSALPSAAKVPQPETNLIQDTHASLALSTFILMPSQSAPQWREITGRSSIDASACNWNELGVELVIGITPIGDLHLNSN